MSVQGKQESTNQMNPCVLDTKRYAESSLVPYYTSHVWMIQKERPLQGGDSRHTSYESKQDATADPTLKEKTDCVSYVM